jgi:hypothetical protein
VIAPKTTVDVEFYRQRHADLTSMSDAQLIAHFYHHGGKRRAPCLADVDARTFSGRRAPLLGTLILGALIFAPFPETLLSSWGH